METTVTSSAYRGMRNFKSDAYHYCARCGSRVQIKDLVWQRGLLICTKWDCVDKGNHGNFLTGQREAQISQVLGIPTQELLPDPKLVTPENGDSDGGTDIISF